MFASNSTQISRVNDYKINKRNDLLCLHICNYSMRYSIDVARDWLLGWSRGMSRDWSRGSRDVT